MPTALFLIWRACERLNLKPPHVKDSFEQNEPLTQRLLVAYEQLRQIEETKIAASRI